MGLPAPAELAERILAIDLEIWGVQVINREGWVIARAGQSGNTLIEELKESVLTERRFGTGQFVDHLLSFLENLDVHLGETRYVVSATQRAKLLTLRFTAGTLGLILSPNADPERIFRLLERRRLR